MSTHGYNCHEYPSGDKSENKKRFLGPKVRRLTPVEVEVLAEMQGIRVLVLEPTVNHLMEVVKVVLRAAAGIAHTSSVFDGHTRHPTVILTKRHEEVATVGSELIREVLGTSHDVVSDILAVPTRSVTTLVASQLHETLFAITTHGGGIAAALLESDRSQKDGRKSKLVTILLKGPKIWAASGEGTTLIDSFVEVHGNQIKDLDKGRRPSSVIDTTVQPVKSSVGASGLSDLLSGAARPAAVILNLNETACVWGCVGSRAWTGRGAWAGRGT